MTIKEAIAAALDDWSSSEDFDFNDQAEWLEGHVSYCTEEWAEANGYVFDEEQLAWRKS